MPDRPWEPEFIKLWHAGAKDAEIAAALGIPEGTARSRIFTLQREGKLGTRPRGGRRVRTEVAPAPVQNPVQSGAEPTAMHGAQSVHNSAVQIPMHGAETVSTSAEPPIPAAFAVEIGRLWEAIKALRQEMHRPVQEAVHSLPEPLFDDPADNTTERWNLY